MKRILTAIPGDSSFLYPTIKTFREMGWEIKNVDYRKLDLTAGKNNLLRLPKGAIRELTQNKRPSIKRLINNNEIIRIAKKWKPDLFLTFKGEIILPETIGNLRRLGTKTVNWYPDHLADSTENSAFLSAYDCFVYWDSWRTSQYHKQGFNNVLYLPFCTIPEKTPAPKTKRYQINFVGRWQPNKEPQIFPVRDLGLKVWGDKNWSDSKLAYCYQGGPVSVVQMIKVIRSTKITLNVHVVEQIYSEGTNVRTFEATGAGGFLLSNKRKCLYELFKVGKEIEIFDSNEELVKKTKFYLKNNAAREKIALAGWQRTTKDHTYLNRFRVLLKYLNI